MFAVFVNMATVIIGSCLGILFRKKLKKQYITTILSALGLATIMIGVSSAIVTSEIIAVIICLTLGTIIGELLKIENRIENAGDFIKTKVIRGDAADSKFTEGFVFASILFCVGSMTIMGSLEAGINRNYDIIYAKSALDFASAAAYGAAMGIGVAFSALFIFVFQGGITLASGALAPVLSAAIVTEMSAIGGVILIGMGFNMLGFSEHRIKVANMLPAIFLPIAYFPLVNWISGVLG